MIRLALAILALTAMTSGPVIAQEIILHPKGRHVQVLTDQALGSKNRSAFRDWRTKSNYFAAIAFNLKKDNSYGFANGFHSLDLARQDAMAICRSEADRPEDCIEYAIIVPRGYDPARPGTTLGQSAQRDFQGPYKKRPRPGTFGAFAIDDGFSYGWAVNRSTAASAREQALLECTRETASARAATKESIRNAVILKNRLKCKIIHVSQR